MKEYLQNFIDTERLRIAYYRAGEGNRKKLLVLHGNYSSSVFFMPLVPYLEKDYDILVPDLRCFGHTEAKPIDATRGYRDWSDDIYEFCREMKWDSFILLGWSMGGDVAMQFVVDHREMVEKLVLVAPGSPYGFGGTIDEKGTPLMPIGLGSGGGTANPGIIVSGRMGNSAVMKNIMNQFLFKGDFRMSKKWEREFMEASGQTKLGNEYYPGNYTMHWKWPFTVAGDKGVLNAMSPKYGNLNALLDVDPKPPVLWIHGDADKIVSDHSMMELGNLGRIGMFPGWPGMRAYPPQPMIRQTRYFLEQYQNKGGRYIELQIPGGHVCILESPLHFISALNTFVDGAPAEEQEK